MKRPILDETEYVDEDILRNHICALNLFIDDLQLEYCKIIKKPSLGEWLDFWKEEGYDLDIGKQVWIGYDENGWRDSNNKLIKSWKLKCRQVWFKPQNKAKNKLTSKPSTLSENMRILAAATNDEYRNPTD